MVGKEQHLTTLLACLLQSLILAPAPHAVALLILDEQIQQKCILKYLDIIALEHLLDGKLRNPASCGITTGVKNTALMVSALQTQSQRSVDGIELHAIGYDLGDTVGTLINEYLHRTILTQTTARDKGVRFMYFGVVVVRCYGRNAALSIE